MDKLMMNLFRKHVWLVIVVSMILFLTNAGCILILRPYYCAHRALGQLRGLQVGQSGFVDAQRVASSIGAVPDGSCSAADCYWRVRVDNSALPEQWRGMGTTLDVGFQVTNSVVTEKGFTLQIGTGGDGPFVQVHEQPPMRGTPAKLAFVETQSSALLPHYRAFVSIAPNAPANIREQYFAVNLDCFWKYRGCQDAQDLLKVIEWK